MKTLSLCAALLALAPLASAQETLGIYFDAAGTQTSTQVQPNTIFTLYVIADNIPTGIAGYEFFVDVPPGIFPLSATAQGPGGTVLDIDSSLQGFIVGLAGCFVGPGPHVLAEMTLLAPAPLAGAPFSLLPTTPSSFGGTSTGYADCGALALHPFVDAYPGPALVDVVFPGSYCWCDGSGAAAPCGNSGAPGHGCANGSSAAGARLESSGSASVGASTLVLAASNVPTGQPGLYFQGDNKVNGGAGTMFGDGLRCAGANVQRLQVTVAGAPTTVDIAAKGSVAAGQTHYYQLWYRDSAGSPCGGLFNLSNGLEITWAP
ncbi:MAG: hypothetical protein H6828_07100 [Planctomycetes bacterium]|nr:hypothetical protein [Planctomycetota bacterium]